MELGEKLTADIQLEIKINYNLRTYKVYGHFEKEIHKEIQIIQR